MLTLAVNDFQAKLLRTALFEYKLELGNVAVPNTKSTLMLIQQARSELESLLTQLESVHSSINRTAKGVTEEVDNVTGN
jgi:hypothetical protein